MHAIYSQYIVILVQKFRIINICHFAQNKNFFNNEISQITVCSQLTFITWFNTMKNKFEYLGIQLRTEVTQDKLTIHSRYVEDTKVATE